MNEFASGVIGLSILNALDNKKEISPSRLITDLKAEIDIRNNWVEIMLNSTHEANNTTKEIATTNNTEHKLLNENCHQAIYFKSDSEKRLTLGDTPFTYS